MKLTFNQLQVGHTFDWAKESFTVKRMPKPDRLGYRHIETVRKSDGKSVVFGINKDGSGRMYPAK